MESLRGERSIARLCREHGISDSLLRRWRDVALEPAGGRLAGGQERWQAADQRRRIARAAHRRPHLGRAVRGARRGAHQPFQEVPDRFNALVDAFWCEIDACL